MVNHHRVPFKISYLDHGYSEVVGLFHVKNDQLVLEFEQNPMYNYSASNSLEEIVLPFSDIEAVRLKKRWFSVSIEIEAKSMRLLKDVPGSEQGMCQLKIKRKHRKDAEKAVNAAKLMISEQRLKELDET